MKIIYTDDFRKSTCKFFGNDEWEPKTLRDKIKKLYWQWVPYDYRPGTLWYKFICLIWHRYTTIKPATLRQNTWVDRDVLLVHCSFDLLTQFIEREKPDEQFDLEKSNRKDDFKKLFALYRWWKAYSANPDECHVETDEVTEKLCELVRLRTLMWT